MSHTLTLPLDVLKTRIQSDAALAGLSLAAVCRRIVTTEGPRALLAGFTANGCGYFMQGAIKFGLYEACKRRIFRELEARGLLRDNRLVDLGCGDCRWLVAARRHCRRLVGYDIDGKLLEKGRAALDGADHTLVEADFFESENILEDGDVVVAYLFREGCAKLRAKLEKELRRGTLVCVGFEMRGWRSSFEVTAGGLVARVYEVRAESSPS